MPPFFKKKTPSKSEINIPVLDILKNVDQNSKDAIEKIEVHDHLCLIYENKKEQFQTAIPFMRIGLERGEKCVYIADDNTAVEVIEAMKKGGIDADAEIKKRALSVISKKDAYLVNGYFDPEEMINFLTETTIQAKKDGYSALRVTGEMTWMLGGEPGTEHLIEYEAKLNRFLPKNDCLALCQYNRNLFDPKILVDVIRTHPIVVVGNVICRNFYYVPVEEFLKAGSGTKEEVDRLLNNLIDREQIEKKHNQAADIIKESERRLREAQKVSHIGSWELNILTNKLVWSEQIYTIFEIDPEKFGASYEAFLEAIHPEDREMVNDAYKESVKNHEPYSIDHRLLMKDGRIKYVHEQCESFYDESGKAIRSVGIVQDITEHKQIEAELVKKNRTLRILSETEEALIHATDEKWLLDEVCRISAEIGGYRMLWIGFKENDKEKSVRPVAYSGFEAGYLESIHVSWADNKYGRGPVGTAIRTGKVQIIKDIASNPLMAPWHKQALEHGYQSIMALPLKDGDNTFGAISVYSDKKDPFTDDEIKILTELADDLAFGITSLRVETEKKALEERFEIIFNNANDGMILADAETKKFSICNEAFSNMLGYSKEEIKNMGVIDIHPEENLPYIISKFEQQLRGEIKVAENIPVKRKDGTIFYADINSSPVKIDGGEFVLGIFRNITERKEMEEALQKSESRLQLEIARMPIGHIIWSKDFKVESWNPAAENIFGFTAEEAIGKHPYEIIVPKEVQPQINKVWETLITSTEDVHSINENITKDGRTILCDWTNTRLMGADGTFLGVMAMVRDVTKEKEIEKLRVDFLSLASHQLRTPLSGTKWLIETLRAHTLGPLTKEQDGYLEKIYTINERMIRLTYDMLSALRLEGAVGIAIEKKEISIEDIFNQLLITIGPEAKNKKITIHNKSSEHEIPVINSDASLLSASLEILLSNAINYSPEGKEVIFDVIKKDNEIILSVQDFGIGIKEEEKAHISEKFYRGSNAKTVRPDGTGLGLYIAMEIAKKLGGSVTFDSHENKGSTFMIHIPI